MIQDISRPDVNGNAPKMQDVKVLAETTFGQELRYSDVPELHVSTDDNLMSSVTIRGSYDAKTEWKNGIYYNSRHFRFSITPAKGKRYFTPGEKVTVELETCYENLKFRKGTCTPEKAVQRIVEFLKANA